MNENILHKQMQNILCKKINTQKAEQKKFSKPINDLKWKRKANFQSPEEKTYYKKRANLNEAHFRLLKNARNFQKLNRTGMKNAEKELTIQSIAHNIQKNTQKTKRNTHLNKQKHTSKQKIQNKQTFKQNIPKITKII